MRRFFFGPHATGYHVVIIGELGKGLEGGIGAFMMLARKWDRIENQAQVYGWDIFDAMTSDKRPEGIIDDIRDLRRYLLLVEEHLFANVSQVAKDAPEGDAGQGYVNQYR
jgi:hypothetical protein